MHPGRQESLSGGLYILDGSSQHIFIAICDVPKHVRMQQLKVLFLLSSK